MTFINSSNNSNNIMNLKWTEDLAYNSKWAPASIKSTQVPILPARAVIIVSLHIRRSLRPPHPAFPSGPLSSAVLILLPRPPRGDPHARRPCLRRPRRRVGSFNAVRGGIVPSPAPLVPHPSSGCADKNIACRQTSRQINFSLGGCFDSPGLGK